MTKPSLPGPYLAIALIVALSACGDDDEPPAGDGDADADADADADGDGDADSDPPDVVCRESGPIPPGDTEPASCAEPDRACPDDYPLPGAPCEGELDCRYPADFDGNEWFFSCSDGAWRGGPECLSNCPPPPTSELCLDPFMGTLDGASVEIGPASVSEPFRAYADCEVVTPLGGPQGALMFPARVRVRGVDVPECVVVHLTVTWTDGQLLSALRVGMHCGESLAVWVVVPGDFLCRLRPAEGVRVTAEVDGIATAEAVVQLAWPFDYDCDPDNTP